MTDDPVPGNEERPFKELEPLGNTPVSPALASMGVLVRTQRPDEVTDRCGGCHVSVELGRPMQNWRMS